ncbi:hypothetical protein [Pectobacterium versatile]|uniref:hypothetical protein n=1 Tax=Pectobacterium versatile TaxID=2488639 RepID=UPI001CCC72CB|nr:hypothetical protein [Pectobacterium versatile]
MRYINMLRKIIKKLFSFFFIKRTLEFYSFNEILEEKINPPRGYFFDKLNIDRLDEIKSSNFKFSFLKDELQKGSKAIVIKDKNNDIISFVFIKSCGDFFISELNANIKIEKSIYIYGANTCDKHRRKGLYKLLLKKILTENNDKKIISVESTNYISKKAIESVDFKFYFNITSKTFFSLFSVMKVGV